MNKMICGVIAASLFCGVAFFVSCSSKGNEKNAYKDVYENNIVSKIAGKWIEAEIAGRAVPTNAKAVITIDSVLKGNVSKGYFSGSFGSISWVEREPFELKNTDNVVSWVMKSGSVFTYVQLVINSVTDIEMNTTMHLVTREKNVIVQELGPVPMRFVKQSHDYRPDIVGLWEGKVVSDSSKFDDGGVHRWEYRDDGTYVYYRLVKGKWEPVGGPISHYYVDGTLLATRWQNEGEKRENREWWEIESIEDGVMNWSALRISGDGSLYAASFSMTRVNDL